MTNVLITGAAGFIGSHFCEAVQSATDWHMHLVCSFRHKGDTRRLASVDRDRYTLHTHDLAQPIPGWVTERIGKVEHIFHFAAESHVERSLSDPVPFIRNNVDATLTMLEFARKALPQTFFQISTDEVYGQAPQGTLHSEWSPIVPSNPYSASKACQEAIAISYWRSYGVPVVLTNTMNNFGERQDGEKFIPLMLKHALEGTEAIIHGDPGSIGSRFYLHARNHASAILYLARRGWVNQYPAHDRPLRLNIVGDVEMNNLEMAQLVARMAGTTLRYKLLDFHHSRPGHDKRYALDGTALREAGWVAPVPFEESLRRTVEWTMAHPEWLRVNAMAVGG